LLKECKADSLLGVAYRRTEQIQARLDAQRARIIDAATEIVADRGYGGCSIAAVSAQAEVSAGTVYNHFAGKSELVAEVFRSVVTREVEAVRQAVRPEDSVVERTVALVETFAGRALKSPRLAYALLAEPVDPAVDALRLKFRVAFRDIAAESIALGIASAEIAPQDSGVVAAALVGAIAEALVGPLAGDLEPSTVPTLIRFALRSLGVPDASHP
jgi:AcrR family transcriptional regulator